MAQITLGVMAMHSKNILHRDIKTQNIFIAKNDILKLGDFGISKELNTINAKAQTSCGTPYFMPPEVCKGHAYDNKADVWAVGVILYELITLKKPFDSDSINGVFEKIINQQLDPLPADVDVDLKMLISSLLKKENDKRPSIFDVANIPCIKNKIKSFI
jgi:serine/threonine protein kinase